VSVNFTYPRDVLVLSSRDSRFAMSGCSNRGRGVKSVQGLTRNKGQNPALGSRSRNKREGARSREVGGEGPSSSVVYLHLGDKTNALRGSIRKFPAVLGMVVGCITDHKDLYLLKKSRKSFDVAWT